MQSPTKRVSQRASPSGRRDQEEKRRDDPSGNRKAGPGAPATRPPLSDHRVQVDSPISPEPAFRRWLLT